MEVKLLNITIGDLAKNYKDNAEDGVVGYDGQLDIRPPYQREFVYKDHQRDAVISTVKKGFPLNVMYWAVRDNEEYEIIDGQQRTISICQYINGDFSFNGMYFHNLQNDEKESILNYELTVYLCSGTDSEKLDWFRTINIAGEELTDQELRNAVYHGSWVNDAKRYFSKNMCPAYQIASKYMNGSPIRQDYLETVIKWINDDKIEEYMAINQHKPNANELWLYFQRVIGWIEVVFPYYRVEMKGQNWGDIYNEHKDKSLDAKILETRIAELMEDHDVTNGKGIYRYVLDGKEKHLHIREFDKRDKRIAFERQKGKCLRCGLEFKFNEMHGDHITPWVRGGKTIPENCQMLCAECNRRKSSI
jgi:hypothetical protein